MVIDELIIVRYKKECIECTRYHAYMMICMKSLNAKQHFIGASFINIQQDNLFDFSTQLQQQLYTKSCAISFNVKINDGTELFTEPEK